MLISGLIEQEYAMNCAYSFHGKHLCSFSPSTKRPGTKTNISFKKKNLTSDR